MRMLAIVLVILGIIALAVPSFTFFTTERAVNTSFFAIDVQRPHTIILNPIVGIVAVAAGLVMLVVGRRSAST